MRLPQTWAAATEEAIRRGRNGVVRLVLGDFLDHARHIPAATLVTLDLSRRPGHRRQVAR
jgi:hypothetical protein